MEGSFVYFNKIPVYGFPKREFYHGGTGED